MTRVENQNPPTLVGVTGPGTGRQGDRGRFDGPPSRLFERAAFVKLSDPGLLKIEIRFEQPLYPVARRVLGLYSIAGGLPFWAKGAVPVLAGSLKRARSTAIHSIMPVTIT